MGRLIGLDEKMQGEARRNYSTGRSTSSSPNCEGHGHFGKLSHGIEVLLTSRETESDAIQQLNLLVDCSTRIRVVGPEALCLSAT